jgi:Flp pilus assembly pilin Flp
VSGDTIEERPMQSFAHTLRQLAREESGAIVSAELALVASIGVLALVTGLSEVSGAVNGELIDISGAICSLDQSFSTPGFFGCRPKGAWFGGSRYIDIHTCGACHPVCIDGEYVVGGTGASIVTPPALWIPALPPPPVYPPPVVDPDCPSCPSPALCPKGDCLPGHGLKAPQQPGEHGKGPQPTPADKPVPVPPKPMPPKTDAKPKA